MIKLPTPVKTWLGQITTGGGFAALFSTISAVLTGQMHWPEAVPLLVAGVVGVLWPENKGPVRPTHNRKTASNPTTRPKKTASNRRPAAHQVKANQKHAHLNGAAPH